MDNIVIVGFGGHARSVADCIERDGKYNIVGYTDLMEYNSKYKYLGTDENLEQIFNEGVSYAVVGIGYLGNGNIRNRLYEKLKEIGYELPTIIDPSAIVSSTAIIGEGTFVGKGAIVNSEVIIGKMAIINTKALVEHECIVGDYSHVAVSAVLCGQVRVGKSALIGANATVIQCIEIEDNRIVPAGVTVR